MKLELTVITPTTSTLTSTRYGLYLAKGGE